MFALVEGDALAVDVQGWVDDCGASNFGWVMIGNEGALHTAKRFGSSEGVPGEAPVLTVEFTPPACPADCGVAGRDVLLEAGSDVYEPLDLGFGRCRLVVACRRGASFDPHAASTVRVATKYPRVATRHFQERGVSVEVVRLAGSVEIAPGLGLADCIVDVVETGRTLDENGLATLEDVAPSSARLIVNRASYHARREEVSRLLETLAKAVS